MATMQWHGGTSNTDYQTWLDYFILHKYTRMAHSIAQNIV